jgi:hypothetical protein
VLGWIDCERSQQEQQHGGHCYLPVMMQSKHTMSVDTPRPTVRVVFQA